MCASSSPSLVFGHRPCGPSGCAPRGLARGQGVDVPANELLTEAARPGRVLAAAMHVSRLEALVLAEVEEPPPGLADRLGRPLPRPPRGWPVFARFLHVDLAAGTSRELARFPRLGAFDQHALVGTENGGYALAATNERAGHTWVFGLASDPAGLHLRGGTRLDGRLRGAPIASERGITLPLARARGAGVPWEPVGVRPSDLGTRPSITLGAAM
ncbi:MAG: hypothetical protein KF729_23890 [Sandaracinaceae bacterium]|nr:hypothetical protein [Sandaracinaceae bacterium]